MVEYIERETAIAKLTALEVTEPNATMVDAKQLLAEMPATDVAPVVHGKWIDVLSYELYVPDEKTTIILTEEKCSNRNVIVTFKGEKMYLPDYVCPNCGARMKGEEEA